MLIGDTMNIKCAWHGHAPGDIVDVIEFRPRDGFGVSTRAGGFDILDDFGSTVMVAIVTECAEGDITHTRIHQNGEINAVRGVA